MRWLRAIGFVALVAIGPSAFAQSRIDQLGAGAAISDTDLVPGCQGCGASADAVKITAAQFNTYIASKGYALGSSLTLNHLALGAGGAGLAVLGSLGTTTTLLHGNGSGPPSFGPVN